MPQDPEHERCATVVRELLKDKPRIYTLTTYGRGETDHVRLFISSDDEIVEITYYVARAVGNAKIKPGAGWPFRGGQYSKGLEAADWAWRIAFDNKEKFDQHRWSEL